MNDLHLCILIITLLAVSFVASKSHGKSHKKSKLRNHVEKLNGKRQQAWNNLPFPDVKNDAYVNADPFVLQNAQGFKNAKLWHGTLPTHLSPFPYTGEFGAADAETHNKFYYDGSLHLGKLAQVNCDVFLTNARACVNEKGCGWCGQSNTCIGASPLGPITPCARASFIYTLPSVDWNPLKAAPINIWGQSNDGHSLLTVTHEPELNQAPVAKPYQLS
jgi:hypothetical protein